MKFSTAITITAMLMLGLSTFAQQNTPPAAPKKLSVAEPKKAETPEPEIATLDAAWKPVVVEHIVGIRGGYGTGSIRREPSRDNQTLPFGLLNFGVAYRIDIPEQKYVGCIEFDLQYMEKGYAYAMFFESNAIYARKYSVIELPILWQPYMPFGKGLSRFFLNAGPYLSYTLGGEEYLYEKSTPDDYVKTEYDYDPLRDNRVEYGVVVGAGLSIGGKRVAAIIDFRYNIALSDAMKGVNKFEGNPFRSPVDQMSLSVGVQYRFIKIAKKEKKNE